MSRTEQASQVLVLVDYGMVGTSGIGVSLIVALVLIIWELMRSGPFYHNVKWFVRRNLYQLFSLLRPWSLVRRESRL